jgi:hypothetical protein
LASKYGRSLRERDCGCLEYRLSSCSERRRSQTHSGKLERMGDEAVAYPFLRERRRRSGLVTCLPAAAR